MSTPKRHHFVPRAYLDRFGENGSVRVRRRDQRATFVTNALNVAVRCGFYDHPNGPENERGELERVLARLDDAAAEAMRVIVPPQSWPRLVRKVRKKARQTHGAAPAWLRIDAMDGLWQIHEFARLGLEDKARALAAETGPVLQHAPHVRGLVVTSGLVLAQGEFKDEAASPLPGSWRCADVWSQA